VQAATRECKERSIKEGRPPSWNDYCDSRPEAAETAAVAAALSFAGKNEVSLHIVHVGTAMAAELIASGLAGLRPDEIRGASCETCPHYLEFSRNDFSSMGSALKTAPPVKEEGQAALLWKMLADGRIAFAASDHAPSPEEEKNTGSPWSDYGGIPGTGTLFPYLYSEGYRKGRLGLSAFLRATGGGAAQRFGLDQAKGALRAGMDADLVLVDPAGAYTVRGTDLLSKGTITPFEGRKFTGSIRMTMVRGTPVWTASEAERTGKAEQGITVLPGFGRHLVWGYT
jgi:dihydroorotase-like cyclic amidohydrolase